MTNSTKAQNTSNEVKVNRVPSKLIANKIFAEEMVARQAGEHETNKSFRQRVIERIVAEASATANSACTMYNTCRKNAELINPKVGLGRDVKKEVKAA